MKRLIHNADDKREVRRGEGREEKRREEKR
jgi:hypothetical protein